MKTTLLLLFSMLFSTQILLSAELSEAEASEVKKDLSNLLSLFESGDPSEFISRTHPSIIAYSGGKENFRKIAEAGIQQLRETGIKFLDSKFGSPSRIYDAGDEEVVVLPRISIMEMNGTKIESTGYMICVRTKGKSKWTYLDGSGLRKRPDMLFQLLPDLDKNIKLPKNVIEKLES